MKNKILVIGHGNLGRQDDGIGPEFIRQLSTLGLKSVTFESNYQLTVENAYDAVDKSTVIFVDASTVGNAPFTFTKIPSVSPQDSTVHGNSLHESLPHNNLPHHTAPAPALTTHALSPEAVIRLSQTLYDASPDAFMLAIRGYCFDAFDETLSNQAIDNIQQAVSFLTDWIQNSQQSQTVRLTSLAVQ